MDFIHKDLIINIDEFRIKSNVVTSEEDYSFNRGAGIPVGEGVPFKVDDYVDNDSRGGVVDNSQEDDYISNITDFADYFELPDIWRVLYNERRPFSKNTEYVLHNGSGIILMCFRQLQERCYCSKVSSGNIRYITTLSFNDFKIRQQSGDVFCYYSKPSNDIIDLGFIYKKNGSVIMLSWDNVKKLPFFWKRNSEDAYDRKNFIVYCSSLEDALATTDLSQE